MIAEPADSPCQRSRVRRLHLAHCRSPCRHCSELRPSHHICSFQGPLIHAIPLMTTTRTPFDASTPDRAAFALSARDHATFIPAPLARLPQSDSLVDRLRSRSSAFLRRVKEVAGNNSGMLLIAASQVRPSSLSFLAKLPHALLSGVLLPHECIGKEAEQPRSTCACF